MTDDEAAVRALFYRWAKAVRDENLEGIRADHDPNMLMFDVIPPFASRGIEAYMATWRPFFKWQARPVMFQFRDVTFTVGSELAFVTATGTCGDTSSGQRVELDFRLTVGLKKREGKWCVVHEHHSIPSTDAAV